MTTNLFERSEKKYILSPAQYDALMARIGDRLADDEFPRSTISSLYYDTPEDTMVVRSFEKKSVYKEKLRVRSYGRSGDDDLVFVELKKKFKGITYKRRVRMSAAAAAAYMAGELTYAQAAQRSVDAAGLPLDEAADWQTQQTAREIDWCRGRYQGLAPKTMIAVDRLAKRTVDGSDVRVTFDLNARWREGSLRFDAAPTGTPLFADGSVIMEVKSSGNYPLWMVDAFSELGIKPQSCSKIGLAYQAKHAAARTPKHAAA